jgi:hypothetical protein
MIGFLARIGRYLERSGHDLIVILSQHLPEETEEIHERSQSR